MKVLFKPLMAALLITAVCPAQAQSLPARIIKTISNNKLACVTGALVTGVQFYVYLKRGTTIGDDGQPITTRKLTKTAAAFFIMDGIGIGTVVYCLLPKK